MRLIGIGHRQPLAGWIRSRPSEIQMVEVTAEHFFDSDGESLRQLRQAYPLAVHGLGLSLGTRGPVDALTLDRFEAVVKAADPLWVSEHVAFTRTPEVDLGHLNPVSPTRENAAVLAEHALEIMERCKKRLLLENIATHVRLEGDLSEPEFLNQVCERSGAELLLDVTNLFVNARNHGYDPVEWLSALDDSRIVQLHVVGYTEAFGRYHDRHAERPQREIWELVESVVSRASIEGIILERDENFPPVEELAAELRTLREVAHGA